MNVAEKIIEQLGGNKFTAMTGASNMVATDNGIQFSLPAKAARHGINRVIIKLNASDLYDVEFGKVANRKDPVLGVRMPTYEAVTTKSGIDCHMLRPIFTEATGLYTHL